MQNVSTRLEDPIAFTKVKIYIYYKLLKAPGGHIEKYCVYQLHFADKGPFQRTINIIPYTILARIGTELDTVMSVLFIIWLVRSPSIEIQSGAVTPFKSTLGCNII